jgi:hypothetical protein
MGAQWGQNTWSVPLDKLAEAMGERIELVARLATYEVFKSVIDKGPIDTGQFNANWFVRKGTYETAFVEGNTNIASSYAQAAKALELKPGTVVFLTNNTPYGIPLEYGYSWKTNARKEAEGWPRSRADARPAPEGMIRLTLSEWGQTVSKAVASAQSKSLS